MTYIGTSQNGWPVYESTPGPAFVQTTAAGRKWWSANKDVAAILDDFTSWWATAIEPVDVGVLDDWSWSVRPIRGQTSGYSNHASATARDINATLHPQGVPTAKTLSGHQIGLIHDRLGHYTDTLGARVLRWGGDYVTALPDAMHIEINASPARVAQAAAKLREEQDMQLTDKVTLTATQAARMSLNGTTHKAGDQVSVAYLLMWGGAHGEECKYALTGLTSSVSALLKVATEGGDTAQAEALADVGVQLERVAAELAPTPAPADEAAELARYAPVVGSAPTGGACDVVEP